MSKRKTSIFLPIVVLTLATLACNALLPLPAEESVPTQIIEPAVTQPQLSIPQSENGVHRVTVDEAKAAFDSGAAIIVDVRSQEAYETSHVAGAVFIPLGAFETDIASVDLPKDEWIITYCT
jgi:hypothetical protein